MLGRLRKEGRGIGRAAAFFGRSFFAAVVLVVALVVMVPLLIVLMVPLLIVVGIIIREVEIREEHFARHSHSELLAAGMAVGYPMTMPETNTDIYVEYDTDTGISWSRALCDEDDIRLALKGANQVTATDLIVDEEGVRLGIDRYREGSYDWWPAELSESQMREGLPPSYDVFSVDEESDYRYYIFVSYEPCQTFHYSPGEVRG
ncbi:MAG: hypothetical protein ACRELU_08245 [Gemmatimonadota bacterium]